MKTIFWNVDTQYDFMRADESFAGSLPVPDAREIETNLARLTNVADLNNITVVNTADWHNANSEELSDNPDYKTTFPPHCMQGTKGAEFIPATKPDNPYIVDWQQNTLTFNDVFKAVRKRRDLLLYKDKFDIFAGNPYTHDIVTKILQPDIAVVYGVATNVCVDGAVRGLVKRGVNVVVPTDAIKELPGNLEELLGEWKELGVELSTTDKIFEVYNGTHHTTYRFI